MKRYLSAVLAAILIAGLTACGGGAQQASSSSQSAGPSASASPTFRAVPNVVGVNFQDARTTLLKHDFVVRILDREGKKWTGRYPDKTVMVVSTNPAIGTVTDKSDVEVTVGVTEAELKAVATAGDVAAKAAARAAIEAAKLAARYQFLCGAAYSTSDPVTYRSLRELWAGPHYASGDTCTTKIDGVSSSTKPALIPSEQAIVDIVAANGGDVSGAPAQTFDTVLQLCAKLEPGYADSVSTKPEWKKAKAKAALALCPDAPHAAVLQEATTAVKVESGTRIVGQTMEPGTYKTKPGSKDCYWSRTTGGGDIIANDFVGFAPNGVTVTVYPGEGFESTRCGVWTKIG
jgi:hypothetical protein